MNQSPPGIGWPHLVGALWPLALSLWPKLCSSGCQGPMNSSMWQWPRRYRGVRQGCSGRSRDLPPFRECDLLDGIIYGALVGIGFAFVEDIVYYPTVAAGRAARVTFFLRGIMAPFAHRFSAATGIGIGIAVSAVARWRVLAPILGFLAAVVMHGIWNGSTFWGTGLPVRVARSSCRCW